MTGKMTAFVLALGVFLVLAVSGEAAWLPLPAALRDDSSLERDDSSLERDDSSLENDFPALKANLTLKKCGVAVAKYEGDKIVGGRPALEGELPWQISLQQIVWWSDKPSHICGGSILNKRVIITAAHCVDGGVASDYQVVVGAHDLRKESSAQKSHGVKKIVMHKKYKSKTVENDIAILILSSSIDFKSSEGFVNGACLPEAGQKVKGLVTVSGWGATREGGSAKKTLRTVSIPVVSVKKCSSQYGKGKILDGMFCAGVEEGGKDSCQGDSGGPLVKTEKGKSTLVGVVSWGYGCARPGYSGVYTNVANYIDWIQKTVDKYV